MFLFCGPILYFLLLSVHYLNAQDEPSNENNAQHPNQVTLSKWEYCAGCKGAVEIFTTLTTNKIIEMQTNGISSGEELDVAPLLETLCERHYFDRYAPFMYYGCLKLIQDHSKEFLSVFNGDLASVQYSISKGNIYSKTKDICYDIAKACPSSMFTPIPIKERTECKGCSIILDDLDLMKKVLPTGLRYGNPQVNAQLLESLCASLGYNHQPYSWLEELCDELVDEHSKEILNILAMRDNLLSSNITPKQSLSERVCEEIYSCDNNQQDEL